MYNMIRSSGLDMCVSQAGENVTKVNIYIYSHHL
jgi:hypothetical protein